MKKVQIPITTELKEICQKIIDRHLSESEWSAIESDDMFQTGSFVGGYDATENAFTFSYYVDESEYWFQLSLDEVSQIKKGKALVVQGTLADTKL